MRKIRKFRLYEKYDVDVWGWLMHQRTWNSFFLLIKMLYRHRLLRGRERKKWNEELELWKYTKLRKGFGRRRSEFKKQLQEKQKTQHFYGFVKDKQLKRFYEWAKQEKGLLENNFAGLLESRLLSVAYRMGFFDSMRVGVQYILHHGLVVDGKRIRKYNYTLVPGQMLYLVEEDLNRTRKLKKKTTGHLTRLKFPFWSIGFGNKSIKSEPPKKRFFLLDYYGVRRRIEKLYRLEEKGKSQRFNEWFIRSVIEKSRLLRMPPGYLEMSILLGRVMLVYRPTSKEIFFPFDMDWNEVVSYYKHH